MPSENVIVPAGQCFKITLDVVLANPAAGRAKGTFVATVTDTDLGVVVGQVSDGSFLEVCEGNYEVSWPTSRCDTVSVLSRSVSGLASGTGDTKELIITCMVDDVNGDGSVLTPYVSACVVNIAADNTVTSVAVGDFTDSCLATPYVPVNGMLASDVGATAETLSEHVVLTAGATWSPTALVKSYTIRVQTVDQAAPPTFVGSNSPSRDLAVGDVISYEVASTLMEVTPVVTAPGSSVVIVTYTELGV